jgi:uncharacterized protein
MTEKPIPAPTAESIEFWDATRRGELLVQRCQLCVNVQFYPRMFCTQCGEAELDWIQSSGRGEIVTFTVVRRAPSPAFETDVPYVIAIVELREGPRMMANIDGPGEEVRIGSSVEVRFRHSGDMSIPYFVVVGSREER